MKKKELYTIPNFISAYRILAFPLLLILLWKKQENLFAIFIIINLVSDVLDGWIARHFNMQTEFGAKLDSLADIGTFIAAVIGIFTFKADDFEPHIISFITLIGFYIFTVILSLIKFRKSPSLHLYSWKIGGYIQGIFFALLFSIGFITPIYYLMIIWGIASYIEHIIIQMMLPEMISNAKGIYWVIKKKRNG